MESLNDAINKIARATHKGSADYTHLMKAVYQDPDVQKFLKAHEDELTSASISRGEAKLFEFVNQKQKIANGEDVFAPGYEPTLVISNNLIDISYKPTKQLQARQQSEQMKQRIRSISMPKFIQHASLDDFILDEKSRGDALVKATKFVTDYIQTPDQFHPGLYLYGNFGVGKTFLLGAIANQLAKSGVTSTLVHFPSFAVEMRNSINSDVNSGEKIDSIKKTPILMLDDVGADSMSAWVRDDVLGVILEYRMQQELPTFFSSNLSMDTFEKEHLSVTSRGDIDPLKARRLMERIRFLSREVTMAGENRRQK